MAGLATRRSPRPPAEPRPDLPSWGKRIEWAAYGFLGGFVAATLASLALLSLVGPDVSRFIFRLFMYSAPLAGFDYAGERARWRQALLRGFALGGAIAIVRTLAGIL